MKVVLFVLLFAGFFATIFGAVARIQHWEMGLPFLMGGMATEAISIGLLLWVYVVRPGLRKN